MSEREKEVIEKIAAGLPRLSEFDKGYFLGIVEAKVDNMHAAKEENELSASSTAGKEM